MGPCLTTKDCQNAAKVIVKFLAEMQVRVYEERERMKIEKQEQARADAEAELLLKQEEDAAQAKASALVADQQKSLTKKEKKSREKKLKAEIIENDKINTSVKVNGTSTGCCALFFKLIFLSTLMWIMVAVTFVSSVLFYPDFYEKTVLPKLPTVFQPIAENFLEIIQSTINIKSILK